jgi:dihydropyrimidine dehydrogenase (NAD+) subunit PreA
MRKLQPGEIDLRTNTPVSAEYANWTTHPNNPMAIKTTAVA